jgi:hypothetical protein
MTGQFEISALWLSPIMREANNRRLIRRVNYMKDDNLIVETPPLRVTDLRLILEDGGNTQKILMQTTALSDNSQFKELMQDIDSRVQTETGKLTQRYIPSVNYRGWYSFFIPVYKNEVNVMVLNNESAPVSLTTLKRGSVCRLVLLLSHVEIVEDAYFPIWNTIQIRMADSIV